MKNDSTYIHETIIRDIVSLISGIDDETILDPDKIFNKNNIRNVGNRNIAKMTSNLTLTFPVIAEESVSVSDARMVCKAVERKCVSMLQMLFSAVSLTTNGKDAFDYLRQFHTNISMDGSTAYIDDFMNGLDELEESGIINVVDQESYDAVKKDLRNINFELKRDLEPSLNRFRISDGWADGPIITQIFTEGKKGRNGGTTKSAPVPMPIRFIDDYNNDNGITYSELLMQFHSDPQKVSDNLFKYRSTPDKGYTIDPNNGNKKIFNYEGLTDSKLKSIIKDMEMDYANYFDKTMGNAYYNMKKDPRYSNMSDEDKLNYMKNHSGLKDKINDDEIKAYLSKIASGNSTEPVDMAKTSDEYKLLGNRDALNRYRNFSAYDVASYNKTIKTDIEKANELMPTIMQIKFFTMVNGVSIPNSAIIGIKAKLQYVTSEDMINRIVIKNKDKNGLFNFLKATTREISFWKDFVFAIDKAKLDALSTSNKRGDSNKIWKMLEHRAIKSRIKRFTGLLNDASAITTLVLSKETSEVLKKEHQIDVSRPNVILSIMDSYNVMGFVIADSINEKCAFLFDDDSKSYEILSYNHLEREEKTDYKKMINLLAKSR